MLRSLSHRHLLLYLPPPPRCTPVSAVSGISFAATAAGCRGDPRLEAKFSASPPLPRPPPCTAPPRPSTYKVSPHHSHNGEEHKARHNLHRQLRERRNAFFRHLVLPLPAPRFSNFRSDAFDRSPPAPHPPLPPPPTIRSGRATRRPQILGFTCAPHGTTAQPPHLRTHTHTHTQSLSHAQCLTAHISRVSSARSCKPLPRSTASRPMERYATARRPS